MKLLDKDIPDGAFTFNSGTTIDSLFTQLCTAGGVERASTDPFVNSTASVTSKPSEFKTASLRNVLQWIAEASCSIARFNRDGKLELAWLNDSTTKVYNEGDYETFEPYYYENPVVDKVVCRKGSTDKIAGDSTAENGLLIQDNPLLKNVR